jgi:hypothetical protein
MSLWLSYSNILYVFLFYFIHATDNAHLILLVLIILIIIGVQHKLGRPRCRLVDNIKVDLVEMRKGGVAQDTDKWRALVNSATNHLVR